jgi:hypothetical protein
MPIFRRRRPPRRRPPLWRQPPRPLSPAARKALQRLRQAHELMTKGKHAEAAVIFDELAAGALKRNLPRAPQLFLQAGRAWIEAGETKRGIAKLKDGLKLMENMKQFRRLPIVSQRVIAELRDRGFTKQANEIEAEIKNTLATHGLSFAPVPGAMGKPRLPAKCPYCGGNVLPNELEWIEERYPTCTYCGSPLEAEG